MATRNGRRFEVLDSWRGICAIIVSLGHFPVLSHFYKLMIVRNSFFFVDFFFVLSGFVITQAYASRLRSPLDATVFMIKRAGRIWPLHFVTLFAMILLELTDVWLSAGPWGMRTSAFSGLNSLVPTLANLFLVHSLGLLHGFTWNVPSWSVSVEMGTYVIFAAAAVMMPGRLPVAAALTLGASLLILAMAPRHTINVTYDLGILRCCFGFFTGYFVYRNGYPDGLPRYRLLGTTTEILIVLCVVAMVTYAADTSFSLAAPLLFGIAVYVFSLQRGFVSSVLKAPGFLLAGRLSYSIYMTHYVLCSALFRGASIVGDHSGLQIIRMVEFHGWTAPVIDVAGLWLGDFAALLFVALTVFVSAITYRHVEQSGQAVVWRLVRSWSKEENALSRSAGGE